MRRKISIALALCALSSTACLKVLGDYEVRDDAGTTDGGKSGPDGRVGCTEATQTTDCASNERCDISYCTKACTTGGACASSSCSLGKCDLPVGAPCAESKWCGAGASCIDTDYNGQTTAWYCTKSCGIQSDAGTDCPSGYECLGSPDYECRKFH